MYSKEQIIELEEVFQLFTVRGDYKINVSHVGDALRSLGQNPKESDVKKFINKCKPDDKINFDLFLSLYDNILKSKISDKIEDFVDFLGHFDKDGNGSISSAELRHLLTTLGEKLTDEEVEDLLTGQKDSQGNVKYEEFVDIIMSGNLEVSFPEKTYAEIVYNSLKVDKEPSRSDVQKILTVNEKKLIIKFVGPNAKQLRTSVSAFMEYLILATETIDKFGPPVSKQYSYFSP